MESVGAFWFHIYIPYGKTFHYNTTTIDMVIVELFKINFVGHRDIVLQKHILFYNQLIVILYVACLSEILLQSDIK